MTSDFSSMDVAGKRPDNALPADASRSQTVKPAAKAA
jgi:hypothetical protein